jgi:hypothetical protein
MISPMVKNHPGVNIRMLKFRGNPELINALSAPTRGFSGYPCTPRTQVLNFPKAQLTQAIQLIQLLRPIVEVPTNCPRSRGLKSNPVHKLSQHNVSLETGMLMMGIARHTIQHSNSYPQIDNGDPDHLKPCSIKDLLVKPMSQGTRRLLRHKQNTCM